MSDRPIDRRSLLTALGTAGVAGLAGCLGTAEDPDGPNTGEDFDDIEAVLPVTESTVPLSFSLDEYREAAISSPADRDGIPAIDTPSLTDAGAAADLLEPTDIVFGVDIDGVARAYPQRVLVWHEIVNDTLGGTPLSVTYCPLTATAVGFERGGTTFGVEGWLLNSNLILFDRATESWWPQVLGTGISGPFAGDALREIPVVWTTWERWRSVHPETTVLTDETGYIRNYRDDPYESYYESDQLLFQLMATDDRHPVKRVVIGSRTADGAVAVVKDRLRGDRLLEPVVGAVPYVVTYDPRLDAGFVYRNPEGRSVELVGERYRVDGETEYGADGLPLPAVNAFDAFWFAWVAFYPDTVVID